MADKKNVALVILDGIGYAPDGKGNAFSLAKKPNLDALFAKYPNVKMAASGKAVGLPAGQMGNSEVGHLNIGAGRIVYTGLSIIDKDIEDKKFFTNKAFKSAIDHVKKNKSKLHIMGLTSDGGVHSSIQHIFALIQLAESNKVPTVLHCFTDGRDTAPKSFVSLYLPSVLSTLKKCKYVKLGTICSRYYAMDRDQNWERSCLAYDTLIGKNPKVIKFTDPTVAINKQFASNIESDEFLLPMINENYQMEELTIANNDAVINANFRPDRARQISHLIYGSKYYKYKPIESLKNIYYVTMMNYEGIVPSAVAYPPLTYKNVLGEVVCNNKLKQLRISETEKYAHVTFFFDGGKEIKYKNEQKIIIPSPKVATYNLQPEMSSNELTNDILKAMGKYNVMIINYPNGDMVGHTADIAASIKAIEAVDACVGKLYEKAQKTNTTLFITADHGNVEQLLDDKNKPFTAHTTNLVPFLITDESIQISSKDPKLSNIAPTILDYLNIKIPKEMDQPSLLIRRK